MKLSDILIIIGCSIGLLYGVWYYRGQVDDKDFAQRIANAPVKTHIDTVRIKIEVPVDNFKGKVADTTPDSSTYKAIEDAWYAGLDKGLDSAKSTFVHVATPVDTNIVRKNIGTEWIYYDPLTHMLIADLQLYPRQELHINRVDSAVVPVYIHDTFWQRASYVGGGTLLGALLFTLVK